MNRRGYLAAAGVGGLAALGSSTAGVDPGAAILGIYPGDGDSATRQAAPFENWLGRRFGVLVHYVDAGVDVSVREWFVEELTRSWESGHVPMVTWLPYIGGEANTPETITREIAAGEYDDVIDWWADALSAWLREAGGTRRLYFRPLPEMNGDWLPWSVLESGDERAFVDAWRRVHDRLMGEIDPELIQWLWNPNASEHGSVPTEACYPGDAYVDWVGIDGYNWGATGEGWRSPREVFEPMRARLAALTDAPLAIPEYGSTSRTKGGYDPARKDRWIRDALAYFGESDVRLHCWFNVDKETDWAVFGSERGTGTHDGNAVYGGFRAAVGPESVLEERERLSVAAFHGRSRGPR